MSIQDRTGRRGHAKTSYTYDGLKRLKTVTQTAGTDTLTTTDNYDGQDNVISMTDPKGLVTQYTYGDLGWRLSASSPDTGHTLYDYDPSGNLISVLDENGNHLVLEYDALNRLTTMTYDDTDLNVMISYDSPDEPFGIGRRTGLNDATGESSFGYDRRGLLVSEEKKTLRGGGFTTGYDYDPDGNVTEIRYPSSDVSTRQGRVDYEYDLAGRVSHLTTDIGSQPVDVATTFQYKPFGPRTQMRLGNGLLDSRTYDDRYRINTWTVGNSPFKLNYTHQFDADSNLLSRTDNVQSVNSRLFAYDEVHRLISAGGPWGMGSASQTYTYDKNGNRLNLSNPTATYTYASGTNRLASIVSGSQTQSFTYDANGNTIADGSHTFEYSAANRLATVDQGATATYTYDAGGHRAMKVTATARTYYFYDPEGRLLSEIVPGSSCGTGDGKDYVYLDGAPIARGDWSILEVGDQCPNGLSGDCEPSFQLVASDALFFYHSDHLGTPIAMTNGSGTVVWKEEFYPFGELFSTTTAAIANNLRFPGQYFESETGLHQNWFRDYQPNTGRYAEADPFGLRGGTNPFVYARDNPVVGADNTGLLENFVFELNSRPMSTLTCDCGISAPAFSGGGDAINNPKRVADANDGPLPPGVWYIVDRPIGGVRQLIHDWWSGDTDEWFALYREDGMIDDKTLVEGVLRQAIRLHAGSMSVGCLTVTDRGKYNQIWQKLFTTETRFIPGTQIVYYGTITVR